MKNIVMSVALLCCLLLSGCSSTKKQLVGKWQLEGSSSQFEFFASGDVNHYSASSDSNSSGKYEWIDKNHIRIDSPGASEIAEVQIEGDTLKLSAPGGTMTYKRIP